MSPNLIFLPVLVQVLLTIAVYLRLARAKAAAAENAQVDEARRALHADAWPDSVIQVNNSIRNQFEVPVLFYVLVVVLWACKATDVVAHGVAWAFAISRLVHAYVHTGKNVVAIRRRIFTFGVVMVVAMTVLAGRAVLMAPHANSAAMSPP